MGLRIRRILVAIGQGPAKKLLARAQQLALAGGAELMLFSVVRPGPGLPGIASAQQRLINGAALESRRNHLEALAMGLRRRGITASCRVRLDYSVTDAIVREVRQSEADLVAIEAHAHRLLARLLLSQSDYDLIRHSQVPLLIVKQLPSGATRPVLAALDPWHSNDKPSTLDAQIVAAGRAFAKLLQVELHSAHVYAPNLGFIADSPFAPQVIPASLPEERRYSALVRRRFKAVNAKFRIAARHSHLTVGDATFALPDIASSLRAQVLVMGAISRSPIKRIFIGNTAERVLDAIGCDLLIVKPKTSSGRRS